MDYQEQVMKANERYKEQYQYYLPLREIISIVSTYKNLKKELEESNEDEKIIDTLDFVQNNSIIGEIQDTKISYHSNEVFFLTLLAMEDGTLIEFNQEEQKDYIRISHTKNKQNIRTK